LTNAAGKTIIKVNKSDITALPNSITQKTNAKGCMDRNYYGNDGKQTKQISNNGHGHKKEEKLEIHGDARELTTLERKENGDFL
jgi:hypothetical protein